MHIIITIRYGPVEDVLSIDDRENIVHSHSVLRCFCVVRNGYLRNTAKLRQYINSV